MTLEPYASNVLMLTVVISHRSGQLTVSRHCCIEKNVVVVTFCLVCFVVSGSLTQAQLVPKHPTILEMRVDADKLQVSTVYSN